MSFNETATHRLIHEFSKPIGDVNLDVVTEALKEGANPDPGSATSLLLKFQKIEPLSLAALHGHTELCACLLNHGANLERESGLGRTPLMFAVLGKNIETCKLLLKAGADVHAVDVKKRSALTHAANENLMDIAKLLLDHGAGFTPFPYRPVLIDAVKSGNLEMVEFLIGQGADVNALDDHDLTPLIWITAMEGSEVLKMGELLLKNGADASYICPNGTSPLSASLNDFEYSPALFRMLLEHGANPNIEVNGQSLEAFAKRYEAFEIVRMIQEYNAIQEKQQLKEALPTCEGSQKKGGIRL